MYFLCMYVHYQTGGPYLYKLFCFLKTPHHICKQFTSDGSDKVDKLTVKS